MGFSNLSWNKAFEDLVQRFCPDGGCAAHRGEMIPRPDATAWACLALKEKENHAVIQRAQDFLITRQDEDGRVYLFEDTPTVWWPSSLAILAWNGSDAHEQARQKTCWFLLRNSGRHSPKRPDAPTAHDTSLRGWSWVEGTHSWVEPTSLATLALNLCGFSQHVRVSEALRMLMDRQLPEGGWNYGNTAVYGTVLDPLPQSTAVALVALAGKENRQDLARSIKYLSEQVPDLHTPLSLAWAILALHAWQHRPRQADRWLLDCLEGQKRLGSYDTESLSLLCLAASGSLEWLYGDQGS